MYSQCGIENPQMLHGAGNRGSNSRDQIEISNRATEKGVSSLICLTLISITSYFFCDTIIPWSYMIQQSSPKKWSPYSVILHIHGEHIAITIGSVQWQGGLHPNQWMTLSDMIPDGSCMYKWYSLHVYTFAQIKFVYLYMYITVYIYIYINGLFIAINHVLVICFCGVWGSTVRFSPTPMGHGES